MGNVFLRTVLSYAVLTVVIRLMGKRQIGELQLSELIIALLLSEIATAPITDPELPLANALIPIATLISLEILITFITTKSDLCKRLFDGTPSVIVCRGKLRRRELGKLRMSMEELMGELRQKGISDLSEVDYALLEQNGKLSVFPKAAYQPLRCTDMKLPRTETGIAHELITDGHISKDNLRLCGKDEAWLREQIALHGLRVCDVFFYSVNDAGEETLIGKEERHA